MAYEKREPSLSELVGSVRLPYSRLEATIGGFGALGQLHSDLALCSARSIEVDLSGLSWVDAHLASALRVLVDHVFLRGQSLKFTNMQPNVNTILRKNGFLSERLDDTYSTTIPCTLFQPSQEVDFASFARRYLAPQACQE